MDESQDDRLSVYEIGYLIATSVPEEKVSGETESIKKLITGAGAAIIAEEEAHHRELAYTIRKKTVSGSYDKYDAAYFGWIKFEIGSDKIEALKEAIEVLPSILRMLVTTTVRENTYLGKRAPGMAVSKDAPLAGTEDPKAAAPATIEEMDKSIDEMVKEA